MLLIACRVYSVFVYNPSSSSFFFFNDTATTEIYTLSLHDALPICLFESFPRFQASATALQWRRWTGFAKQRQRDRKSTRLNSSHQIISYAVFCLKKKKCEAEIYRRLVDPPANLQHVALR